MSSEYVRGDELDLRSDLQIGAKSLVLTLNAEGKGSAPIPDNCTIVGVMMPEIDSLVVGLEVPQDVGSATGNALTTDWTKGILLTASNVWVWFNVGRGSDRTLYLAGSASSEVLLVVT
jgi:hypothetical protein